MPHMKTEAATLIHHLRSNGMRVYLNEFGCVAFNPGEELNSQVKLEIIRLGNELKELLKKEKPKKQNGNTPH
jgi:hypothetical protein